MIWEPDAAATDEIPTCPAGGARVTSVLGDKLSVDATLPVIPSRRRGISFFARAQRPSVY